MSYNKKVIKAWTFYDWANSVYSLVISTAIFPIYFNAVADDSYMIFGQSFKSTAVFTAVISFSFIIISLLSPILSSIADVSGNKKSFMKFFCTLGALACMSMYFFDAEHQVQGLVSSVLASIGFWGSIVFYNAYLPEIAPIEDQDKISAKGFSRGYLGSSILLIICLSMIIFYDKIGISSEGEATRLSFVLVGIWWLGFSQYTFANLPSNVYNKKIPKNFIRKGYQELNIVWKKVKTQRNLKIFLYSFFFLSVGVQTIILVASLFGAEVLGMGQNELITTILLIQFVGMAGAHLFANLSGKKGNYFALMIAIAIWMIVCIGAYFIQTSIQFYAFGGLVGLVLGGIQSLARSTYSKILPSTEDHTTFFSFFDVTEKVALVLGTLVFASITQWMSMRESALALAFFFLISLLLMYRLYRTKNGE
jgi:UMF1 family MFS transporter